VPPGFALAAATGPPDAETWAELCRRSERLLAAGAVAVRSSARGEDSAGRSFAGLFDTVLGVRDRRALGEAVARCIASGMGERVRVYAGDVPLPVGVVVQSQIAPRAAGVCFTVDPLGEDGAILVEAVAGLGEALVAGHASPERWRSYRTGHGGWEAQREAGAEIVLDAAQAARISGEALELAGRLGHALDLEWALDAAGTLWWLQARPVTAAVEPPRYRVDRFHEGVDDGPVSVWANWNLREVMPQPFPPLDWTLWRDEILPSAADSLFGVPRRSPLLPYLVPVDRIHGRMYWNMNALYAGPLGGLFLRNLGRLDARAGAVARALMRAGVLRARRLPTRRLSLVPRFLWAGLRAALALSRRLRPRGLTARMEEAAARIRRRPPLRELEPAQLVEELKLFGSPEAQPLHEGQHAAVSGFFVYTLAERAFARHADAHRLLTAGIRGNPTTQISIAVDELTAAARGLEPVFLADSPWPDRLRRLEASAPGRAWLAALGDFQTRFGHRCPNEFTLGSPRWAEDPTMILELVRAGLSEPARESVASRLERLEAERSRAVAAAVRASPLWLRPILPRLARLVEEFMPLREAPKHFGLAAFQRMRAAALELGRRFAGRGLLELPDDVFFLEWAELQAIANGGPPEGKLRERIQQRRAEHRRFLGQAPPDFLRSDGVRVREEPRPAGDGALHGSPVSGGSASGPVRILHEPDPAAMADGDVIVMVYADPGWTPLFPRASAIVMEVGGAMCHAAVIARELGIPAVFGVEGATTRLREGQRVTVNGSAGSVAPVAHRPMPAHPRPKLNSSRD
jgi:pyruvate,water dikinase